jgi:(E)-4-hydroxy-3-methylbut-2-enyl-diphosphate synthase
LRKTKEVIIGSVRIGKNNPIRVQSMCNTKTKDSKKTIKQILELEERGCEIIRVAVPDIDSARALKTIKKQINIPLVADIHYDYRLAIVSAKYADKIRINPGNIGDENRIKEVIKASKENSIPIRIGINLASIEKDILKKYGSNEKAMVISALKAIKTFESNDFENIVLSLKASDVTKTVEAYELISKKTNYPLHLGITEAGTLIPGITKSAVGFGILLNKGIGDTIRVSLTENPVMEVEAGYEILKALNLRKHGTDIISCPTCARTSVDLITLVKTVRDKTKEIKTPLKIAIMGCIVNGPGEAKEADIGLAFSKNSAFLFKKGIIVKKISNRVAVTSLMKEIDKMG